MIFSCFTQKFKEKVGGFLGGQRVCCPPPPSQIIGGGLAPWLPLFLRPCSEHETIVPRVIGCLSVCYANIPERINLIPSVIVCLLFVTHNPRSYFIYFEEKIEVCFEILSICLKIRRTCIYAETDTVFVI